MNAGSTMERVYLDLKAQIIAGTYPPGSRLDPFHLAKPLAASATPVREALHRLAGERIIDSWHQEGFRQPIVAEADLCDLYGWAAALIDLLLHVKELPAASPEAGLGEGSGGDYAGRIARLFRAIALIGENREFRYAITNLIERTQLMRAAELRVDPYAATVVGLMEADFIHARWTELRRKNRHFHRRRIALAHRVVAELRPRSQAIE